MRHLRAAIVVTLLGSTLVVASPASPVRAAATPPADAPPVTLIGDSTMAGMQWDAVAGDDPRDTIGAAYKLTIDAESCRRILVPSCRGRFGTVPQSVLPLIRTKLAGKLGEAVVIMAGYDDASIADAVDQVVNEAVAQGVTKVIWLTYRTNTDYVLPGGLPARDLYGSHNAELIAAGQRHSELQILDWDKYSANQPTWFAWDGVHLTLDGANALATFIKNALDAQPAIGRCRASRALTGVPDDGVVQTVAPTTQPSGFVPLAPRRVLDTRDAALGGASGKLGTGRTVTIDVSKALPAGAVAAVLSVTATGACYPGFLTAFACGPRPPTSNVNYELGRSTAGVAITPTASGTVCVFASAATDVVVDVMGAFDPGGDLFHPITPKRWVDTRGTTGAGAAQLPQITGARAAHAQTQVMVAGQGGVPADATGVWLNLTIADPTAPTVLTAYPGPCSTAPLASNVNARTQRSTASSVLVGVGPDGSICVLTYTGNSHIVIDVAGWFGPGDGGLSFEPKLPTRLLDTRLNGGPSAGPSGGRATTADIPVHLDGIDMLNVAAVDSTALGWVTVRPCGSTLLTSLINTTRGEDTANLTAVGGNTAANVCVRANVASHLVVDEVATFVP